jgi:NADPH:quinone reductase
VRAAVCRSYGAPEVVVVDDFPAPDLGPGQVLVAVRAAAVNFPDVLVVADEYQMTAPLPFVPGSEFAGEVTEVASDVAGVAVGDRVFGSVFIGAFADEVAVEAANVTLIPGGVDDRTAAAFGVAHKTAFHVLRSVARVQPGEELVVLGAGGGVGLAAVQLGVLLGARVTAVASTAEKLEAAGSYGAAELINHREVDLRAALKEIHPTGTDVVVDPVGGPLAEPALRSLHWQGRFVTVGYASGEIPRIPLNLILLKGIQVLGFQFLTFATNAPDEMLRNDAELMALLADGRVAPHIGATFAFDDVTAALRHVADGNAIGKVLLTFP